MRKEVTTMSKTGRLLLAYAAGQATQLVIHAMCLNNNMYAYKQIPFCVAAGFVIFFALLTGVFISNRPEETADEPKHISKYVKPYIDYVKEHTEEKDTISEVIPQIYDGADKD